MSRYKIYNYHSLRAGRHWLREYRKSNRQERAYVAEKIGEDFADFCRIMDKDDPFLALIMMSSLLDEEKDTGLNLAAAELGHHKAGAPTLFVEHKSLLEMLHRAKFEIGNGVWEVHGLYFLFRCLMALLWMG